MPDSSSDAPSLDERIEAVAAEIDAAALSSEEEVEAFRIRFLGRKQGAITDLFGFMREVPPEDRAALGRRLNALKQQAEARLETAQQEAERTAQAQATDIDLTLPGRPVVTEETGSLHPLRRTLRRIEEVFRGVGFAVARGPEIEDDWHNFSALNFPPDHPARDMQDTFFLEAPPPEGRGVLLRTHTSPVQIRVLEAAVQDGSGPPVRIIAPGRVYRNEAISYKSFCLFHQVEGLVVDEHVSFADLKAMLYAFAEAFFENALGGEVKMRFRPSFFPFTEPSAEVDVWWEDDNLKGGGRWMEILGCGMVDPNVLGNVGIDAERYTGYAFGMGVERMAMLRYGIQDIRLYYENDVRFLEQF